MQNIMTSSFKLSKSRTLLSAAFCVNKLHLFAWDHDPQQKVDEQTRHAAWNECNDQRQPEPERADAEEFCQTATDTRDDAITT